MSLQLYSLKKNFAVQKAERFFKERRAQVQAVGPGKKLGAAALLLNDLDLHLKTFLSVFCLIVQPLPGSCQCGLLLHKFLCFGILPESIFREKFAQFSLGEKVRFAGVVLNGKPAILGILSVRK